MRTYIYMLSILYIVGCSNSPQYLFNENKPTETISLIDYLCLDSIGLYGVGDFCIDNNNLLVRFKHPSSRDVLGMYNIDNNSYKSLVKRGRGPYEMLNCSSIFKYNRGYAIIDCNMPNIAVVNGDSVIYKKLTDKGASSCISNGEYLISTGVYPDGRYRMSGLDDEFCDFFCPYPKSKYKDDLTIATTYISNAMAMNPDNNRFVCVNYNSGIIDICNINSKSITLHKRLEYHYPDIVQSNNGIAVFKRNNINGFYDVTCSREYIYAIYSGKSYNESQLSINKCDYLIIYDWDGNMIKCMKLEQPMSQIYYDIILNKLFGLVDIRDATYICELHQSWI